MNPRFCCPLVLAPLALMTGCASSARVETTHLDLRPATVTVPTAILENVDTTGSWTSASSLSSSMGLGSSVADLPDAELDLDLSELSLRRRAVKIGKTYTQFKLGAFEGAGDLSNQDTGYWAEVVFGREVIRFLSVEASIGYIKSDGPILDVWTIPFLIQARVQLPVLIFAVYGGVGLGGAYVDGRSAIVNPSGFAWAGDAFLGAEIGLGNLALGLEGRYFATTEVDNILTVEGSTLMLMLKVPF